MANHHVTCRESRGQPAHAAEAIADAANRVDQMRVLLAELGPQAPHVDIDGPCASEVLVAPHPGQKRLAAEDPVPDGPRGNEAARTPCT